MELIHIYNDGSKLFKMSALALTKIPVWKGNRIIDQHHVNNIIHSVNSHAFLLDSGYKIIQYDESDEHDRPIKKSYLIDGQHRISAVSHYFDNIPGATDFQVTVTEVRVESEADAIDYFNKINNVKPIHYDEDPILIVNKYIHKLVQNYSSRLKLFRPGATKRPYMSIDKLRDYLVKRANILKTIDVNTFVNECTKMNVKMIQDLEIMSLNEKEKDRDRKMIHKMIELGFGLAWDDKFKWLDTIVTTNNMSYI